MSKDTQGLVHQALSFSEQGPLLSRDEVLSFANKNKLELPTDYISFLVTNNGGVPSLAWLPPNDIGIGDVLVHLFYSLGGEDGVSLQDALDTFRERIPKQMLPIGSDPGGDPLLLSLRKQDRGMIYFWHCSFEDSNRGNPERALNMVPIATSVTDMLSRLVHEDMIPVIPGAARVVDETEEQLLRKYGWIPDEPMD